MNGLALGFWDIVDQALRSIGRGAAWFLMKKVAREEQSVVSAMVGGALVCAVFGAVAGFALSDLSRIATMEGAIIGGLLGVCMGVFFGTFVETVDGTINDLLSSLNSK